jgi:hypothetical protein
MFNHQRQLFGIRLLVPTTDGMVIEKPSPSNPFDQPARPITSLLQFAPEGTGGGRVKVTGTVASFTPGKAIFIQDDEAGLYCQTQLRTDLQPGDTVEVVGFPSRGQYTPILEDAVYRKASAGNAPEPDEVEVNQILTGVYDCRLVQLPARVVERVDRGLSQFLILQAGDMTFQAFLPQQGDVSGFAGLLPGSEVVATGICMIERGNQWQAGDEWRARSFHLLLRSPNDVAVIAVPASFNVGDETWLIVGVGIIAFGLLIWVAVLRRKVHTQAQALRGK